MYVDTPPLSPPVCPRWREGASQAPWSFVLTSSLSVRTDMRVEEKEVTGKLHED